MYKPAPARPKKTNICRSRTGCKSCRQRRKKCDEQKPCCGGCEKLGRVCEPVSPTFEFRTVTEPAGKNGTNAKPAVSQDVTKFPILAENNPVSTPAALVPKQDPKYAVRFYINKWEEQCLPAMHISLHHLSSLLERPSLITDIMATLSACRLSRSHPQRKMFRLSDTPGLCFRPDAAHECLSSELYGSAIRKMAWWSRQDFDSNPTLGLAVLVLFCYLEASMGNFQEFRLHSDAIEKLTMDYNCSTTPWSASLLAAWVEVKMQNWWRRAHFSTPDFHHNYSDPLLCPEIDGILATVDTRRALMLWMLCESHRINAAAVIARWDIQTKNDIIMEVGDAPSLSSDAEAAPFANRLPQSGFAALAGVQSNKLDLWYASLPASDRSEATNIQEGQAALRSEELQVQPLRFNSHNSAMNFAYYATARALLCTGPLQSLDIASFVDIDHIYEQSEAWVLTLLRVAAGIDWKECIRCNVFTIGLAGLLLTCAMRSRRLVVGLWIQQWLEDRLKGQDFEEGNFPVFQILDALRLVNRERRDGRDVFSLFQAVNDGGGSGKFGSYHSQLIKSFLVYARCRTTGDLQAYYGTT
ncbi:hypothetical protein GQ53DRAFT_672446 [Thozetella sp. PMI_491]|nr:hypothetical protein GQ53DRAFT_672446 [Thozetella sp. PMI_491]